VAWSRFLGPLVCLVASNRTETGPCLFMRLSGFQKCERNCTSSNDNNIIVSEKQKPNDILTNKTAYGDAVTLGSPDWSHDWDNLPTKDTEGHSLYYTVEETSGPSGYTTAYANNEGIQTGTIVVTNISSEGYVLPKTGGSGTGRYLATGMAMVVAAAVLLARRRLASF
jgi:LPXTG-motif cell wall-anchored protein